MHLVLHLLQKPPWDEWNREWPQILTTNDLKINQTLSGPFKDHIHQVLFKCNKFKEKLSEWNVTCRM